jgi:hypothetical protein
VSAAVGIAAPTILWTMVQAAGGAGGDAVGAARAGEVSASETPRELGRVRWERDYDRAQATSVATDKPIFLLFQEVPGCRTCVSFGEEVLSNPLLVEAIEDEFVPVAILNNRGGADRRVLERFREPAWNNPVVRFVDAEGHDWIPRRDRVWRSAELAERMIAALEAADRPVPAYLSALREELDPARIQRATFSMSCYWAGEACLGGLPGLLSSRTGTLAGREVVEVRFDAGRVGYAEMLRAAQRRGCADGVFAHGDDQLGVARRVFGDAARIARGRLREARSKDQKYHLRKSRALRDLDLTPRQATRLNHAVWAKQDPTPYLTPRQKHAIR